MRKYKYKGKKYTLRELAKLSGLKYSTIRNRLHDHNYSVEYAVEKPITKYSNLKYKGKIYKNLPELSRATDIPVSRIRQRLDIGLSVKESVESGFIGNSKPIKYKGVKYRNIKKLAKLNDFDYKTIARYIRKAESSDVGIEKYIKRYKSNLQYGGGSSKAIEYKGVQYKSIKELADLNNFDYNAVSEYIRNAESSDIGIDNYIKRYKKHKQLYVWGVLYKNYAEVERSYGIRDTTLRYKMENSNKNITIEQAILECLNAGFTFEGKHYKSITMLCEEHNMTPINVFSRLSKGWTIKDAITRPVQLRKGLKINFRGVDYISKADLGRSFNIEIEYINKLRKKYKKDFLEIFSLIIEFLESNDLYNHKNKPSVITKGYAVIYNDIWVENLKDFTNICNVSHSSYEHIINTNRDSNYIEQMEILKNAKIRKYKYKDELYSKSKLEKLIGDINNSEVQIIETPKYPKCTFNKTGLCFNYKEEFNKFMDEHI